MTLKVSRTITIIRTANAARKAGIIQKPIKLPKRPNSGGRNVEPTYALAICIPIIAPEFSAPKLYGVE